MIEIPIGPNLFDIGGFVVAWHGALSFVGVVVAVYLVARWAPLRGIDPDVVYSMALWAVLGGFVGARAVHVIDNWNSFYLHNPGQIIAIWSGGIGVWGGILGGFAGGVAYVAIARVPRPQWGILMDLTAPALLLAQTIGRLGDFANGEHCAKAADHFLSMTWTHPESLARVCDSGHLSRPSPGTEPVILYEIVWNTIVLAILWSVRGRLKPNGMIWALYISLYAIGRFAISFAREDKIWAAGMQEAHFIALAVLAVAVPILVIKARWQDREPELEPGAPAAASVGGTRASRRRRQRR